ncbi:MAG: hypothetical protein H0W02_04370 [Ktedonobacteraceae bacterium]|nr:hypothetical protein [Ktedonobacteraceae bacterium]
MMVPVFFVLVAVGMLLIGGTVVSLSLYRRGALGVRRFTRSRRVGTAPSVSTASSVSLVEEEEEEEESPFYPGLVHDGTSRYVRTILIISVALAIVVGIIITLLFTSGIL